MTTDELRAKFESETNKKAVVVNQYTYPTEQYFNWLEQQLVKLFAIPVVSTRTWEFSYDEDFSDIEMTLDVPDDKDPYDLLLEHVPDDIAPTLWYRAI